jgi:hypothetical protein
MPANSERAAEPRLDLRSLFSELVRLETELWNAVEGRLRADVDRIEASGYCLRSANPGDRRSSIIALTPAGKRLLPKLTAAVDDQLRSRLSPVIPDRSLIHLTKTFTKLRAAIRAGEAVAKTA